jgi:hypothetical protein
MVLLALALGAIGLVWIGQGLGLIRGSSPMTDDERWAIAGAALIAVGVVLGAIAIVRSRA